MTKARKTAEELRQIVGYCPKTGTISWLVKLGPRAMPGPAKGKIDRDGYRSFVIEGVRYSAHRLAWLVTYGEPPVGVVDHINGDPGDNRIENLRDVSQAINAQNRRLASRKNTTGYLGVSRKRGSKFDASICVDGKKTHIGTFDDPEAAHLAYVAAKRSMHAGCTI